MGKVSIAEVLEQLWKAEVKDNLERLDLWVKKSNLKGYSIVKGLKSFTILTQKGEIPKVANPSRERVGLWFDYLGFIRKINVKADGEDIFKHCIKYVSGYGFVGYQYSINEHDIVRLDFISYYNPTYYIVLKNFGAKSVNLNFYFKPEIRFMWPLNEIYENLNYEILEDKDSVLLWSNYSEGALAVNCISREQCSLTIGNGGVNYGVNIAPGNSTVFIFSPNYSKKKALDELTRASKEWRRDFEDTYEIYYKIAYDTLNVEVGNSRLEKAFIWAKITMFTLYSETNIGNGWFAGAPVFSWFFGRDSAWTGFTALALGMIDNVWAQIKLLAKFQSVKGQIPHEIVLIPNIGSRIKTGYMSIDSTILWLVLLKELYIWSLNKNYIAEAYDSMVKAYNFLSKECDVDNDLFLENQPEKLLIGWPERWASKRKGKCIEINSYWVEALKSISFMAKVLGNNKLSREAERKAKYLKEHFDEVFWNDKLGYYRDHVDSHDSLTIFPIMALYYKLTSKNKALSVLKRLKKEDFKTPWGLRSVSLRDPIYDGGYHSGAIWPLHSGWVIVASLNYGDLDFAKEIFNTLVDFTFENSDPGRINEVYSDIDGHEMGQFIQAWSSAALIHAIVNGFFKIEPKPESSEVEITIYPLEQKMKITKINVWGNIFNVSIDFEKEKITIECIRCLEKLRLKIKIFFKGRFYEKRVTVRKYFSSYFKNID